MLKSFTCLVSAGLAAGSFAAGTIVAGPSTPPQPPRSPAEILRDYVADFRSDPAAAEPRAFGVRVTGAGGGSWTVAVAGGRKGAAEYDVELRRGAPRQATFVYAVDAETLAKIDAGRMNALTAQGKSWSGDIAPMDVEWMDGAAVFDVNPFSFHFWTRGLPEKVPFASSMTREVHGADNVACYYEQGIRTVWSKLDKGDRVNNGPGQSMIIPFPIMIFAVSGRSLGTVGGRPVEAKAGEMVFIPPMTPYEWWNEDDEPAEAILVMFGEGA